jgi:flagellar biosynthesis protein FlhF
MQIKKFVAPTMKEALELTKKELGNNAVIIKSNRVKTGGLLNYGKKDAVEILAAVDSGTKPAVSQMSLCRTARPVITKPAASIGTSIQTYSQSKNDNALVMFQTDLDELKQDVAHVTSMLKYQAVPALPQNLQYVMKQLLDNEVDAQITRTLVEEIHTELLGTDFQDLRLIISVLLKKIGSKILVASDKPKTDGTPRVVMLIGPTGVGKTTTIAKLAANQKLINKKKVALISSDTFRIGAIDQLKTFAGIAEIPLTVVYTPVDMKSAIRTYQDMDIIYIDTIGRSQRDTAKLKDMVGFVQGTRPDETHLVLSVTTRLKDLLDVAKRYELLKYNRILLTKVDETTSLGIILNLGEHIHMPISYITTGQNVPEDIERATVGKLARMIVRGKSN